MDTKPNLRLRQARLERQLAIFGLAARAGVSASTISAAEHWGYLPGPAVRTRLAETLGVPIEELWPSGEEEQQ